MEGFAQVVHKHNTDVVLGMGIDSPASSARNNNLDIKDVYKMRWFSLHT